jgi:ribonuclease G
MGKEIIINARKDQTRIAIVEDGELAEMYFEDPDNERTLGDIYLGRVRRIMPSIQAAFIDIGQQSDAFLHFSDIADNVGDMIRLLEMDEPDVGKVDLSAPTRAHRPRGPAGTQVSMSNEEDDAEEEGVSGRAPQTQERSADAFRPENLKKDQQILVKIVKEPISSKGSRVSTDISLAGRFLVLVPLADYVAVSKKIVSHKERRRLRALAKSLLPKGFGLIVRTVAEDKNAKILDTDLRLLVEKWRRIEKRIAEVKNPPAVLHQDVSMVSSVIRDLFSDDYDRILIDDQRVYRNVKGYIQAVAPQMAPAVKFHSDRQPVFVAANIDKAFRQAFEPRVDLPSGGYLIIEHTEAMHVIDVNSGRAGRGLSQEQNSLRVNMEAARMVAQQLRLRDLGGIIVVDFIDLREDKNRKKVFEELKRHFRTDRAVTKVLPMSDFGVMQITRQRLRPSITILKRAAEAEPVAASLKNNVADNPEPATKLTPEEWREKLERWVARYHEKAAGRPLILTVHPFAKSFLGRGVTKATLRWFWKYRLRIRIETNAEQNPMSFRFFDAETGDELTRRGRSGRRRGRGKGREDGAEKQSEGKSESRKAAMSTARPEGRSAPRPEGRSAPRSEGRSAPRPEGRSAPRSEGRSAPRPEAKRETRPESRAQTGASRGSGDSTAGSEKTPRDPSRERRTDEGTGSVERARPDERRGRRTDATPGRRGSRRGPRRPKTDDAPPQGEPKPSREPAVVQPSAGASSDEGPPRRDERRRDEPNVEQARPAANVTPPPPRPTGGSSEPGLRTTFASSHRSDHHTPRESDPAGNGSASPADARPADETTKPNRPQ